MWPRLLNCCCWGRGPQEVTEGLCPHNYNDAFSLPNSLIQNWVFMDLVSSLFYKLLYVTITTSTTLRFETWQIFLRLKDTLEQSQKQLSCWIRSLPPVDFYRRRSASRNASSLPAPHLQPFFFSHVSTKEKVSMVLVFLQSILATNPNFNMQFQECYVLLRWKPFKNSLCSTVTCSGSSSIPTKCLSHACHF